MYLLTANSGRALTWSGGRYREDWQGRHSFGRVPPLLAALDPVPPAPHLLLPLDPDAGKPEAGQQQGSA